MKYLSWNEETVSDLSLNNITDMYEKGYVFTRIDKGVMQQTRSLRINLAEFELSSENRRILKKLPGLEIQDETLPLKDYNFSLSKMAKDFYDNKFGTKIMSAQKVKEMLTDSNKSNFNLLLCYKDSSLLHQNKTKINHFPVGYTICYFSTEFLHYSYPFYDLINCPKDMGLVMMIKAIIFAKKSGLKNIYLGSLQRPTDVYKLQFSGLQWFDGKNWNTDLNKAKKILNSETI